MVFPIFNTSLQKEGLKIFSFKIQMNLEATISKQEGSLQFNFVMINSACLPGFATHPAPLLEPPPSWS